jgi:hypothetical protein
VQRRISRRHGETAEHRFVYARPYLAQKREDGFNGVTQYARDIEAIGKKE